MARRYTDRHKQCAEGSMAGQGPHVAWRPGEEQWAMGNVALDMAAFVMAVQHGVFASVVEQAKQQTSLSRSMERSQRCRMHGSVRSAWSCGGTSSKRLVIAESDSASQRLKVISAAPLAAPLAAPHIPRNRRWLRRFRHAWQHGSMAAWANV